MLLYFDTGFETVFLQQKLINDMVWFVQWSALDMEELWSGVAFDSVQQILSWEPACQAEVVVTLCQKTGESVCQNLADASQSVTKGKVRHREYILSIITFLHFWTPVSNGIIIY